LLLGRTPFGRGGRRGGEGEGEGEECRADAVIKNIRDVLRVVEAFDGRGAATVACSHSRRAGLEASGGRSR
ncbi:MAG: hypothetical protein ACXQTZ_00170, partial [Candidatus Alkanophagales archaeon]